jgi:hypothetical protein
LLIKSWKPKAVYFYDSLDSDRQLKHSRPLVWLYKKAYKSETDITTNIRDYSPLYSSFF